MLTRRDLLKTACLAAAPEARRPNLLFMFSDQHSSDMLGCYGNRQVYTPNLDRLASEGVRFGHCISNTPVCSPYRAMLMSGQHPLYNGVFSNDVSILHNVRHFAEVLRDSGYRTGYVGKWHLYGGDRKRPIPAGPDRLGFDDLFLSDNCSLRFGPKDSFYWNAEGQLTLFHEWQPYGQARQAVEFLDAQSPDRPFALFVSVHPPHNFGPDHYKTEPELMAQYNPAAIRLRPNVADTPEIREWYRGHMAMITGVDRAFGRVLDKLREKKLDGNTVVVFTADHGDLLRSHGRPWPKSFPEAESSRVPLLARWPGHLPASRTSDLLIGTLDLMPTLVSLMGASVPTTCQGRNLSRAVLDGDSQAVESVPFFYFEPCWRGVYTHRYTYSFGEPGQQFSWDVLYDRERDPWEQKNLFGAADQRGLQRKMDDLTRTWMRKFGDDFASSSELRRVCFNTQAKEPVMKFSKDGRIPGRPIDLLKKSAVLPAVALVQMPPRKPAVWIGPPGVENGKSLRAMFEHPDEWKETRSMVDGLLYADHNFRQFSDEDLRLWFSRLREWKLRLSLEVGAIKEWGTTGDVTFTRQRPTWDRIQSLGGKIYSVAMDEPFLCARQRLKKTDEYAVEETARFIALVREHYPDVLIGDIETYPSISIPDHHWWIENLNRRLREKHVRELDFYRLDVNWINFTVQQTGSWKEVKQLEQYCRARRLPFSLIYWPADLPSLQRLKRAGDSTWYISIMRQAQDYAVIGGAPDEYVIESWVGAPSQSIPETADWTFTRSVRDFVARFVAPAQRK